MIYPIQLISMALFALDGEEPINAWDACTGKAYGCLECGSKLKLRRGELKFPHFYHLSSSPSCRLYSKSERHLLIQLLIQKILSSSEASVEKPFKTIQRIADICWEKNKIIFEIQCSPISELEAKERISEYKSLGYEVVWILDDRLFNKKHVTKSEYFIRSHPSFYISGENRFYDQLEIIQNGHRYKKGLKTEVWLNKVHLLPQIKWPKSLPSLLNKRLLHSKFIFENDLIDQSLLRDFENTLIQWEIIEKKILEGQTKTIHWKSLISQYILGPYKSALNALLDRT